MPDIDPINQTLSAQVRRLAAEAIKTVILCSATLLFAITAHSQQQHRAKYNFNSDWKLFVGDPHGAEMTGFDDSTWKEVTTPHAWNEDDAFKKDIKELSTGIAWYRKHFKLPASSAGMKVFLEFEGIRQAGEFYLNGNFIGRHENGVMAFGFDITPSLIPGENVLAVRIDNSWTYKEKSTGSSFQWIDRNFYANYGGINKNVFLHITSKLHQTLPLFSNLGTTGVYIYAQALDIPNRSAKITAESQIRNEYSDAKTISYRVIIRETSGRMVKSFGGGQLTLAAGETKTISASARVSDLNLWSWGYGYLYDVTTILKVDGKPVDVVTTRTGFRKTEFANGVVKLNDRVIHIKGYAQRTTNEWPAVGLSVPPWVSDFSNKLMVDGGANTVRWMHVTPWKQDVESCDRVGLMQAMPAGDSERDVDDRRWQLRLEVMRDAIIYNRNNPSIIFYESGNKGVSEVHMREMKALRDKYDPYGGRASGSREMLNSREAEYGGEMLYINKSARIPMWAMEYSRDEALRKYWDEFSPPFHKNGEGPLYNGQNASDYNRNQDSHAIENVTRWFDYWRERPGTGTRVSSGGVNIVFSDSNTHHRGAQNYRTSGEVDAMRLPKDGYFANQVMWDNWVNVERPSTYIIGHWNYVPGTKKNVYVVSNTERVELFLNEKSLGFGEQSSRFLFTFKDVAWQPGKLRAVGYDHAGKKINEAEKRTAGQPTSIRLTTRTGPGGLRADGADFALIDVEVMDAEGNRCPTALDLINFSLSGPAEWRGGIAQGPDNFILAQSLPVENGINRIIIRSTPKAGRIVLTANAEGLKSASVEMVSLPVKVEDGLSTQMPDRGLVSNLDRGPTPKEPSFVMSRKPVRVVRATAGANDGQVALSFDDDETTAWASDGKLTTGWIKYEFERSSTVREVTMKVSGWRTQSYPIRVFVDDKLVFDGITPRSLGYITMTFPPVTGSSLKIELTGTADNRDAFGNIVEIPGTPDPQSAAGTGGARNTLSIIELEIYERPRSALKATSLTTKER